MKRLVLLLFFFLCFQISYSQISVGLRTGMNLSDQKFKDTDYGNYGKAIGLYGGVFAQLGPTSKRFNRVELNYTQKGVRHNIGEPYQNVRFNYLTFNYFYGYRPFKNFSVLVGPEIGYLTQVKEDSGYGFLFGQANYKKWDGAANLGVEYKIFKQLSLEARYSYGFRVLLKQDYVNSNPAQRGRNGANQAFSFGLNYKFIK